MTIGVGYVVSGYLTLAADLALLGHFDSSLPQMVEISSFKHLLRCVFSFQTKKL
jgi:hypothetical protein